MRFWLVKTGEPLPSGGAAGHEDRLLRTGMLARNLAERGHDVVWWSDTFDHFRKTHLANGAQDREVGPNLRLTLLHGPGYRRNVSLARIAHHRALAAGLAGRMEAEPSPDLIVCSMPTIEFSAATTRFGRRRGIPVVLDLRDRWPDIFEEVTPRPLRPLLRPLLRPARRMLREACREAFALTGISPEFVAWGLAQAGRTAGPFDRHFWHSHFDVPPSETELTKARARWDAAGVRAGDFVASFLGTMSLDITTILEAAARLKRQGDIRFRFVLCGSGDRLDEYRRRAAGLDNVILPGWIGKAESWELLRRSSVGLAPYPARSDFVISIPNKIAQYLSAGLPILSSLPGRLERLLGEHDCGLTYEAGSAAAIAAKLGELARNEERRGRLAENARALYTREFEGSKVLGAMTAYLEHIAGRAGGPWPSVAST